MNALKNFRTYDLSIAFYKECKRIKLPHAMKDQLMRAADSVTLNLSEGSVINKLRQSRTRRFC